MAVLIDTENPSLEVGGTIPWVWALDYARLRKIPEHAVTSLCSWWM